MKPPTDEQRAYLADVLRRLRDHFHEWPGYERHEHELVGFAYYEGCGDSACCGDLLAEAAPIALGVELVARHGFRWVSLGPGWFGVVHAPVDGHCQNGRREIDTSARGAAVRFHQPQFTAWWVP